MAIIARLVGEGIGPFKSFDFDFSDAAGNPHPGPHIFAGINGSGKSTVLRTIAWLMEASNVRGFQWQEWQHLIEGHACTRAMVVISEPGLVPFAAVITTDVAEGWEERLQRWARAVLATGRVESLKADLPVRVRGTRPPIDSPPRRPCGYLRIGGAEIVDWRHRLLVAGYGPSRLLKYLPEVDLSARLKHFEEGALSFEATVQNQAIQSWLLGLFSKRAIAKERGEIESKYSAALGRFEQALGLMCGQDVQFSVDIEPSLQPRLLMYHKRLDFSQLPDGVRSTVGWLADFLMRMDLHDFEPSAERARVLLLDEVDAHLHPRWQRSILPSIKQALPEVQVFATSHSPFVIASCPGARIHVLELDDEGHATNRPAENAPFGENILATMKDIFGVSSRFDIDTEKRLEEWNDLRRLQAKGNITSKDKERLAALARDLAARSEELRQIVSPVVPISDSLAASLQLEADSGQQKARTKART